MCGLGAPVESLLAACWQEAFRGRPLRRFRGPPHNACSCARGPATGRRRRRSCDARASRASEEAGLAASAATSRLASGVPRPSSTSRARRKRSRPPVGRAAASRRRSMRSLCSSDGLRASANRSTGSASSPRRVSSAIAFSRASNESASRAVTRRSICSAVGRLGASSRSRNRRTATVGRAPRERMARKATRASPAPSCSQSSPQASRDSGASGRSLGGWAATGHTRTPPSIRQARDRPSGEKDRPVALAPCPRSARQRSWCVARSRRRRALPSTRATARSSGDQQ